MAPRQDDWQAWLASGAALLAVVLAVTLPLLGTGFYGDDPIHLHTAATHHPWDFLISRSASSALSPYFFTPLLGTSIALDWPLFGLDPTGYLVHGALSLLALGLAVVVLLRSLDARLLPATLGGIVVVASPATVSVASWLATRHYVEGAAWALLSCALAVRGARRSSSALLALAAVAYLLAALSKEAFVLLPALACLLAGRLAPGWRWRLAAAATAGVAAYAALRIALHGTGLGGYHDLGELTLATAASNLGDAAPALLSAVFWPGGVGSHALGVAAGSLLLTACLVLAWRRARLSGVLGLALVLGVALAPVSLVLLFQGGTLISGSLAGNRFAFPFTLALLVSAAVLAAAAPPAAPRRSAPRWGPAALLVIALASAPGAAAAASAWRGARAESGRTFAFVREHWSRQDLVVRMEGIGVFREGTRTLLDLLCPGPHLVLAGGFPIPRAEARAVPAAAFYHLPADLAGHPVRSGEEIVALLEDRRQPLIAGKDEGIQFSVSLRWTGVAYEWSMAPASLAYLHSWEPTTRPAESPTPCGAAAGSQAPRPLEDFLAVSASGMVDASYLEARRVTALHVRIRAVDGDRGYRDSPVFLVDLAEPTTISWAAAAAAPN